MDQTNSKLSIPAAIIIAGILVAGAVSYNGRAGGGQAADTNPPAAPTFKPEVLRPIDKNDHRRGSENPAVVIMEYSDLECPFCKQFHQTILRVTQTYGNQVAWVYRHFPLPIHPLAQKEAEATECVSELGGPEKFWEYTDKIFAVTPSNNGLDSALLPKLAAEIGINRADFETCLTDGRHADKVKRDADNAVAAGGRGTPFSIIITKDGAKELGGAVPFEQLESLIKDALKNT